ncbi:CoA transferase [Boseongicola sp. H5]|uniref:CoA transferase n=1 Tax=Boseongicola sp. H5 TaxID=2763261 RepID=UPI001D0A4E94|nr:CoA transferase [Boseongicola sp. H5]
MATSFLIQIEEVLGGPSTPPPRVIETGTAELPSCFAVTDLAVSTMTAAAKQLAALTGAHNIAIDRRRASLWFDMTLRPKGWVLPNAWDAIAGVYQASDGWIRLHTNAPHHREAALRVLDCDAEKAAVGAAVATWCKSKLEEAIVAGKGAAAAMHSLAEWAAHPQGQAVAQDPLIAWNEVSVSKSKVALQGLKVLDLTRVLAGPVATRFLAGYGAHVLRIDPPWWSEPGVEPEVTLGKRRAGLNLTCAEERQTFEGLLAEADVLVHGYRPGALSGLGYDKRRLRTIAPDIIEVSLCAYGLQGPWAERRGFDSLVQMSCGIAHEGMLRKNATHPVPLPVQALDHATGYLMAAAILRAMRVRNKTGQVLSARLSLARTAALLMSEPAQDFSGHRIVETEEDLSEATEKTSWGPARRLCFPILVDGAEPNWPIPSGELRTDPPKW